MPVDVQTAILAGNERTAAHNREHFRERGVVAVNLMGSPGAGKTAMLEATARALGGRQRARRARRRSRRPTTTPIACARPASRPVDHHRIGLSSRRRDGASRAAHFPWRELDYLFIENVGNLVCPAVYDLGQEANVVALSVTEGEDKPLKYPVMFRKADLVLITKIDLLPHLPEIRVDAIADALGARDAASQAYRHLVDDRGGHRQLDRVAGSPAIGAPVAFGCDPGCVIPSIASIGARPGEVSTGFRRTSRTPHEPGRTRRTPQHPQETRRT